MKINLVCIEDSLMAIGFRKMASYIRLFNSDTNNFFITSAESLTIKRVVKGTYGEAQKYSDEMIRNIALSLAEADIIGFSCYSSHATIVKRLFKEIKTLNSRAYIIWGGIHPIIDPEDAIQFADAICTGEGEFAFRDFFSAYSEGKDYFSTKNFWFKKNGSIIRNDFRPLATGEEMDKFPYLLYGENELIWKNNQGFCPLTVHDYIGYTGLAFNFVWSIGCPYECSYCGNTVMIENDKNYRKIRHPSVNYLIGQVKDVITRHPHISTIVFHDDSFMAIPRRTILEFADQWKREVDLPFAVNGVIPSFVREEKFDILVGAGMNRVRMGIQSGSDKILEFYKRPNKPGLIHSAATIISKFKEHMIPPAYDIILDNPVENNQDVLDTLDLLYNMPRPFTLNIYSLRVIKNSVLEKQLLERKLKAEDIAANYAHHAPTMANILVYLVAICKLPRSLFEYFKKHVKPYHQKQPEFRLLLILVRFLWMLKRTIDHVRFMDFSVIPGRIGWYFWKLGIIKFWHKKIKKPYVSNDMKHVSKNFLQVSNESSVAELSRWRAISKFLLGYNR